MTSSSKSELRQQIRDRRRALLPDDQERASAAACGHLRYLLDRPSSLAAFASHDNEISVRELCEALLADGSVVAFPRVTGPGVMELVAARSWAELEPGTFGIAEPTGEEIVDAADLDVILLPGVAFDQRGGRLGFGGGYYDRALERVRAADARGKKIPFLVGVGYHWQLLDEHLPVEDHDVRVDAVVTDRGITRCRQDAREDSS